MRSASADGSPSAAVKPPSMANPASVVASPASASRGCRHTQYRVSTSTTAIPRPSQSVPHGWADVQGATGAASMSQISEATNASSAHRGCAHRAGTAASQRWASGVRQSAVPGGMCSAGNGTGCLVTRALWPTTRDVRPVGIRPADHASLPVCVVAVHVGRGDLGCATALNELFKTIG
ncbi:hypothetical protein SHIRM173S_06008 [Streptomyces hirsutus]